MKCPRCQNQSATYIYKVKNQYYCRKCISFSRVNINASRTTKRLLYPPSKIYYKLDFELSKRQKEISNQLVNNFIHHHNSYVWAVCGSGKTEIVFEVIQYALNHGHRVCFCIPRKELVRELYQRIQSCFHGVKIGLLYGGCNENKDAQFIICTMHQLYRFENDVGFDLMIADEVDAFPFYGNDVLQSIFERCCLGSFIKLSATFSSKDIENGQLLIMNKRYHGVDLPVPRSFLCPLKLQKWIMLLIIMKTKKRWIIYVPTTELVNTMVQFFSKFHIPVQGVSSKTTKNQESLQMLKDDPYYTLISTTLLERGITIEDVHVMVYYGNHVIFDERTLIQIAGRVGRKPNHPHGSIYIFSKNRSMEVLKCIKTIKKLNRMNV